MDVKKTRTIIGMDFGDGESMASVLKIRNKDGSFDDESKIERLFLDNGGATKKPTTVAVGENGQFISFGDYERDSGSMIQHFKRSPGEWDHVVKDVQGKRITSKDCMTYFVKSFIHCVLNIDENKKWFDGNMNSVALFVGCPSGKKWTEGDNREKYEKMIREATGIKNVCVVPESTAAVFSALRINQKDRSKRINFSLNDGIAVYDFGSLTSDFTYMLLGKTLIELSWRLGAASIEANIWKVAVENAPELTPWMGKSDNYIMALRKLKEQWFGDFPNDPKAIRNCGGEMKAITVVQADPLNPGIPMMKTNAYAGARMSTVAMDIPMYPEFVDICLNQVKIADVEESGKSIAPASYSDLVRQFFARGKKIMDDHKVPYHTVIITGGASRMDLIRSNCEAVFESKVKIINDPTPSYCVSDGLCQVASNMVRLEPAKQEQIEKTSSIAEKLSTEFQTELRNRLFNIIFQTLVGTMKSVEGKIRVDKFKELVEEKMKQAMRPQAVNAIITESLKTVDQLFKKETNEITESVVKQLYADESLKEFFGSFDGLGRPEIASASVNVGQPVNTADMLPMITKMLTNLIGWGVGTVIAVILWEVPILNVLAGFLAAEGIIWFLQNRPGTQIEPKKYADKLKKDEIKTKVLADSDFQESVKAITRKESI